MNIFQKILNWATHNKLSIVLIIIILLLFGKNSGPQPLLSTQLNRSYMASKGMASQVDTLELGVSGLNEAPVSVSSPAKSRMVMKDSYFSLLVKNVVKTQKEILTKTSELGGFMVNSTLNNPQEVASATLFIRIPSAKLDGMLEYLRSISVKVVSENLQGQDITDQFTDVQARLVVLQETKTRFEGIMAQATQVQDILAVQREILNIQDQIDSLKGQEEFYKKSADLAKVTVYLSTDELALPYAPSESWRPEVIFKEAVRSLVGCMRRGARFVIWAVVFSVIWLPVTIIGYVIYRKKMKNT